MIEIKGSVSLSFNFPAALPVAYAFYRDLGRTVHFLPHISTVYQYSLDEYRMLYSTTELGIYRVRLFCDLCISPASTERLLKIVPIEDKPPVQTEFGIYSLTAQGYYASESIFHAEGEQTRIDYLLALSARLPVPIGIRFMPDSVLNSIASSITQWRIHEIAQGFINRSIAAFNLENQRDARWQFEPLSTLVPFETSEPDDTIGLILE